MHDRKNARDAILLQDLRSLQKAAEQQALIEAQAKIEARSREMEGAHKGVDAALDLWMDCVDAGSVVDPARLGLAAATLALCEIRLSAATDLHDRAREALDSQSQRLAECTTRLTQAEGMVQTLNRRLARRLEEQRQSEVEERTAFDWSLHV